MAISREQPSVLVCDVDCCCSFEKAMAPTPKREACSANQAGGRLKDGLGVRVKASPDRMQPTSCSLMF